mmetsp:Transcript_38193/g.121343  ORF Transcript_38193/g.121343 Transcript_38193/m.121343 type:complete len:417 (+) Transcript_38193:98-1348(+)
MRVFVNNVDGYLAGAICADLWKLSHHITGTQKGSSLELVPPMVKKLVPRIEVRRLLKAIAQCDVVIYDLHDADLEELELVLRTLHISELPQDMVFILISSVGTWARTQREYEFVPDTRPPPEQEGGGEQEAAPADEPGAEGARTSVEASPALPRRPVVLKCEDYIRRVPTPKFQEWKTIETLVLALKEKGTIRPYVVCAGVPYGNGEDAFLSLFKAAWQCKDSLRVISSGHNYIPTVHVRDAARLVRHLLEERPALEYHLAVDRGDLTQRAFFAFIALTLQWRLLIPSADNIYTRFLDIFSGYSKAPNWGGFLVDGTQHGFLHMGPCPGLEKDPDCTGSVYNARTSGPLGDLDADVPTEGNPLMIDWVTRVVKQKNTAHTRCWGQQATRLPLLEFSTEKCDTAITGKPIVLSAGQR